MTISLDEQMSWYRRLATEDPVRQPNRRGTASLIDASARIRAVESMKTGQSISIARPLQEGDAPEPGYRLRATVNEATAIFPRHSGSDVLELKCHGRDNTHVDGLCHVGLDGTWYGGFALDDEDRCSVIDWADTGFFTRAIYIDIAALRQQEWADPAEPVADRDLNMALESAGVRFEPGDALLVDMGRDRFEASGHRITSQFRAPEDHVQTGLGFSAAHWIASHSVSVVCWDFQDAVHPDEPRFAVHPLNWAIGQVLVDNCDFARLRHAFELQEAVHVGALVFAPLPIPGGTGANVNPLVLL
jgi:hypothetical protein